MRRYVFYLAVVFLAFGIGTFAVFKFYWLTAEKPFARQETIIPTGETQPENKTAVGFGTASGIRSMNNVEVEETPKLSKPTCSDKSLLPIWNALKEDTEFKERAKGFYRETDCSSAIEIQQTDLNEDGKKEFIVWGRDDLCGATGNCLLWIYEQKNGKYKQLLQSYAYNGESKWFAVNKSKTNGYRNLLLKGHFTASETTHHFYKFNGGSYVETKCWIEIYHLNEEKPSIMTCREYDKETERQLRESQKLPQNQ